MVSIFKIFGGKTKKKKSRKQDLEKPLFQGTAYEYDDNVSESFAFSQFGDRGSFDEEYLEKVFAKNGDKKNDFSRELYMKNTLSNKKFTKRKRLEAAKEAGEVIAQSPNTIKVTNELNFSGLSSNNQNGKNGKKQKIKICCFKNVDRHGCFMNLFVILGFLSLAGLLLLLFYGLLELHRQGIIKLDFFL